MFLQNRTNIRKMFIVERVEVSNFGESFNLILFLLRQLFEDCKKRALCPELIALNKVQFFINFSLFQCIYIKTIKA